MTDKLRIVFAGTPEIAQQILTQMLETGFVPELVLTQPDRPSGRGMKLNPSPVKVLATKHEIAVMQPLSFKKDPAALAKIRELAPDIMVVVAYGLILPQELLAIPRLGCINIHVSLLPKWRGAAPIQRAVLAGDQISGVTIMQMDAGLDTGDVLIMESLTLAKDETSASLHDKLAALGGKMLIKYLKQPEAYLPTKQAQNGVSYAHKLSKDEAKIDWSESAELIERKIRGYNPVPGAFTFLDGQLHKIWSVQVVTETMRQTEAGTIILSDKDQLWVSCGNATILAISEIQEAGSKRKPAHVYLLGKVGLLGKIFRGE